MRFLLAIHYDEDGIPSPESPEAEPLWKAYNAFTERAIEAGVFVAAEALGASAGASCVSATEGGPVITDGPFAETKEHLGGFYLLDCADHAEALRWASACPGASHGSVEVRAVLELGRAAEPDVRLPSSSVTRSRTS